MPLLLKSLFCSVISIRDFMAMKSKGVKIAILSGKGGTGKTLVSVNLASIAEKSVYIDCDVEEPNGHLFFMPEKVREEIISVKIPVINESLCNGCRKCVDYCKFNALAFIKNKPYVFEEVCHSCGGCMLLCPEKAIGEQEKPIGKVQKGVSGNVTVHTGIMNTGEASGIPIIKKLLNESLSGKELPVFIDCPPSSACIVMESIKDADYAILVAEPTVFGVHKLSMVYELVRRGYLPDYVIGGFHLYNHGTKQNAAPNVVDEIGNILLATHSQYYTCHCTGIESYNRLKTVMGENIDYISTGEQLTIYM